MALNPFYRNNFKNLPDSYKFGYEGLLKLWEIIFDTILTFSLNNKTNNILIHNETIKIIYDANIIEDRNIINYIIKNEFYGNEIFLKNKFLEILTTEYAYKNAPYFV